ncbi:MAG: hypothetical protein LC808_32685, partial [Actinobacteria bacterium]|nr:hypothetical protein [Actinomycetota bacterium]
MTSLPGLDRAGLGPLAKLALVMALVATTTAHLTSVGWVSDLLTPTQTSPAPADAAANARVGAAISSMPLSFIENQGQLPAPVSYYVQGATTSVYFTPGGVNYVLSDAESV